SCRSELHLYPLFPAGQTMPSPRSLEGPRITSSVDLPLRGSVRGLARRAQSLRGHTFVEGRGLPTALPAGYRLVLDRGSRGGLRRYERVFTRGRPRAGQFTYPTRNFATLGISVTPSLLECSGVARSFLPSSSCRHKDRTVPSSHSAGVSR